MLETVLKNSRRKSAAQSGISKSIPPSIAHRRRSLGGMVGNQVIRPGIPATTLPELLKEAEDSLIWEDEGPVMGVPTAPSTPQNTLHAAPKTPSRVKMSSVTSSVLRTNSLSNNARGPRDWSKLDWKTLDGCYTDERISVAEKRGFSQGKLAAVGDINPEFVVERFIQLAGGNDVVSKLGSAFTQ
jgi:hypothetical protein